jgi:hypothetical protein
LPILALDTATLASGVAVVTQDKVLAELTVQTRKTHSELLMPHIIEVLKMAEVTKNEITALAVMIISVSALYFYMMRKRQYRGIATAVYIPYVIAALVFGITKISMV